jgi:hypothetical protein
MNLISLYRITLVCFVKHHHRMSTNCVSLHSKFEKFPLKQETICGMRLSGSVNVRVDHMAPPVDRGAIKGTQM